MILFSKYLQRKESKRDKKIRQVTKQEETRQDEKGKEKKRI